MFKDPLINVGNRDEYQNLMFKNLDQYKEYEPVIDERYQCYGENMTIESEKIFYQIVQEALESIGPTLIPRRSLLWQIQLSSA